MLRMILIGFPILVGVLTAQERLPASGTPAAANLPAQAAGDGDLLAVTVYGAPELTRTIRVSREGSIRMPMLAQSIEVRGLLPDQIEARLVKALAAERILVDPIVTVTLAEIASRPVRVAGSVRRPLTFQADGRTTLLDALSRAEGLAPEAGTEILVTRPSEGGFPPLTTRVLVKDLIENADPAANLPLAGGEEVRVPESGRVFVVGNVVKPGGFPMPDADGMNVMQAMALAEGLTQFAGKIAYVYRAMDGGAKQELTVELRKILDRKSPDIALTPGDILYLAAPPPKNAPPELYFHFDSWRVNIHGLEWIPAHIYVEEAGVAGMPTSTRFKAQTRIWDYVAAAGNKLDELTQILIDTEFGVHDESASRDVSPLESQRAWERQAEENVLARLEKGGLLAPPGPVDDVLNTVISKLIVSAGLDIRATCRVLLTTPLETFSIGHTIVISRGLIDVLPDETSLALVLADELAHIALAHPTPTQFAFHNQTMMSEADLFQHLRFERSERELDEASAKTIAIMRASPYQKTGNAGLFLKALRSRSHVLPRLLAANIGNQLANEKALARLSEFTATAPQLEEDKLEQISALPLGSRVKLDAATGKISLTATKPLALLSAREKMPFEVTPFVTYLVRVPE